MEEKKEFYLIVKGEKVIVSEEVYREYVRPVRKEQRRQRRNWRCRVIGQKGNLVRCQGDCTTCAYAKNGKPNGNVLSLDEFREKGYEIENRELDLEADYIEEESDLEWKEKLHKAIGKLNPRQQEIVKMIFFEGKSKVEVAEYFGVGKSAISHSLERIYAVLKKFFDGN